MLGYLDHCSDQVGLFISCKQTLEGLLEAHQISEKKPVHSPKTNQKHHLQRYGGIIPTSGKRAKSNPQRRATSSGTFEVQGLSSIITIQPRFGWECSRRKTENKFVSSVNDGHRGTFIVDTKSFCFGNILRSLSPCLFSLSTLSNLTSVPCLEKNATGIVMAY